MNFANLNFLLIFKDDVTLFCMFEYNFYIDSDIIESTSLFGILRSIQCERHPDAIHQPVGKA